MRRLAVLTAVTLAHFAGCAEEPAPVRAQPRLWYSGGTAHNVDAARWGEVDDRNRLATSADLVAWELMSQGVPPNALDVEKLKPWATELEDCISQALPA